jgi:hypothetical protein
LEPQSRLPDWSRCGFAVFEKVDRRSSAFIGGDTQSQKAEVRRQNGSCLGRSAFIGG